MCIEVQFFTTSRQMKIFSPYASVHATIGWVTLVGTLLVVFVLLLLIAKSGKREDGTSVTKKVYKIRKRYFIGLTSIIIILLFIGLSSLPYPKKQDITEADEAVTVVAYQWMWKMAHGETNLPTEKFEGKTELDLPVNKLIKFVVSSNDVNHNFAVYNSEGTLLIQTQAMPGYHNVLYHTFKETGDYKVLCLEYCGLAHAYMVATIHVR